VLHPYLLSMAYDRQHELRHEIAQDRLADALPCSPSTPRLVLSRLLRAVADALDPHYAPAAAARSGRTMRAI